MLRWILRRRLDAEEKKLGESVEYLRHIVEVSPIAFLRFASIVPFANCRQVLPKDVWYTAQLATLQHEDCGPCLQITVNLALADGVDGQLIRAVLDGDRDKITHEIADVADFARSIARKDVDVDALRNKLQSRYGDRGMIELSYAIAAGRIPPTVKRVLGYAKSCQEVTVRS